MTPHLIIIDDVFPDANLLRDVVLRSRFETVVNPIDHVEYPYIAPAEKAVERLIGSTLKRILNRDVHINFCFARAMPHGVIAPNEIHHDQTMGQYSAHLYLNPTCPPFTGTQFWYHPFFKDQADPDLQNEYYARLHDQALGQWFRTNFVHARINRLLIHDSKLWHSASPNQGFGMDQHDGRLVLTTFFDLP